MKKLMFAIASAAAMVCVADGIESNIVGYDTQAIASGLKCAALQFTTIGGEQASLANISTKGLTPGWYDTMEDEAPAILIYNGVGYDFYYYIQDGGESYEETGWCDPDGLLAGDVGIPSTGFWLQIPEGMCDTGSLTEAGEVSDAASTTIDIAKGLTLAGNPYPMALDLSKVVTEGIEPGWYDTMEDEAPCIMIYNGVGYDFYYYIQDGGESYEETGWCDPDGLLAEEVATVGAGFWLSSQTAGTLTFMR